MTHTEAGTHISQVGVVMVPVSDQDRALEFYTEKLRFRMMRMGDPIPPMFFFRDRDGNRLLIVGGS